MALYPPVGRLCLHPPAEAPNTRPPVLIFMAPPFEEGGGAGRVVCFGGGGGERAVFLCSMIWGRSQGGARFGGGRGDAGF